MKYLISWNVEGSYCDTRVIDAATYDEADSKARKAFIEEALESGWYCAERYIEEEHV